MIKKLKYHFSRIVAFVSPRLWRKIFSRPSHWDSRESQERLFRYVRNGVSVRLPRNYVVSEADLKRANELQEFARSISEHHSVLDFVFSRPMAEDENF